MCTWGCYRMWQCTQKVINDVLSECGWMYLGGPWTWSALIAPVHTRCTGGPASEALGVEGHLTGRGRGGGGREDGGKGASGGWVWRVGGLNRMSDKSFSWVPIPPTPPNALHFHKKKRHAAICYSPNPSLLLNNKSHEMNNTHLTTFTSTQNSRKENPSAKWMGNATWIAHRKTNHAKETRHTHANEKQPRIFFLYLTPVSINRLRILASLSAKWQPGFTEH